MMSVLRGIVIGGMFLVPMSVGNAEDASPAPEPSPAADAAPAEGAEEELSTAPDPAPQSMIAALLGDIAPDNVDSKVANFYDPAAVLEDPFGRFEQRTAIASHLKALLKGTTSVAFEVRSEFQSGDETVALWTLSVSHPKLGDEPVVIEGVTHARFVNGKIAEQRDVYDVGGLVYERVTFVGALVRWVKGKVAKE
jgi:hypothetical protein